MDPNWYVSASVGGFVSLVTGIIIAKASKKFDLRAQIEAKQYEARAHAEAALMGIGPTIITQQNVRIDQLSAQLDVLWKRERDCQEQLDDARSRIERLEKR
jgi:GTP cyclohydrolase II